MLNAEVFGIRTSKIRVAYSPCFKELSCSFSGLAKVNRNVDKGFPVNLPQAILKACNDKRWKALYNNKLLLNNSLIT